MSGHSKWANIKHKKAAVDAKKGKVWSRLAKNIITAARGGADPSMNARLRLAVDAAKSVGMPRDNIERAIKKGSGASTNGAAMEEILYEGYGCAGTAVICEILTDNRNRTAPEVRKIFESCGGKMGNTGCVGYMFDRKGLLVVEEEQISEDALMELLMEVDGDYSLNDGIYEVTCDPENFTAVAEAFEAAKVAVVEATISRIPQNTMEITDLEDAQKIQRLISRLEDHDDVSAVYSNYQFSPEIEEQLDEED
ncbi:MAG: YebC/PmpR family DNA-binding transcriptional regulator [Planctomycetaceae bacterium]|nr:YebC/PmpR family DNA-binding transcriptional regulator [Planctomycetaceae bacterium]MBQ2820705.1 YebC/PmpR family DNA-binding transcriptional regulator [Thermoguttaceae bacterium]MDO4425145.1 YebC/PmpR family DNA-binding transcriptional regulator [Planctomycetia bacterium]